MRARERGVVAILAALVLFVFFGLAAAFLDLGFARHTQALMQGATDLSAVEGRRLLDVDPLAARRSAARMVRAVFDDDLLSSDRAHGFGAGPAFELSGGLGDRAAALQSIDEKSLWLPDPQLNEDNAAHGDLVTGAFIDGAPALESSAYRRLDFVPGFSSGEGAAFLSRLRRTGDPLGLDRDEGVSSAGPALPFWFGRATAMKGDGQYEPRWDGISVRATSIAAGRRATTAGPGSAGIDGLVGLVVLDGPWAKLPAGSTPLVEDGSEAVALTDQGPLPIGWFADAPASSKSIGDRAPEASGSPRPLSGFCIQARRVGEVHRIVGFSRVQVFVDETGPSLFKARARVAPLNVSAAPPGSQPNSEYPALQPEERREILLAHSQIDAPLLAAALVR